MQGRPRHDFTPPPIRSRANQYHCEVPTRWWQAGQHHKANARQADPEPSVWSQECMHGKNPDSVPYARKLAFMDEAGISLAGPMKILLRGNPIDCVLKRLQAIIKGIDVSKMHRISVPLYELGIWDFNRLVDAAGRHMIDTDALSRLPDPCSRVTIRHKRSLNRLTLLLNGHDWMGQAPAHAYNLSMPLPKDLREVKRGLSMADMVVPCITKPRRISTFPCTAATSVPPPSRPEHAKIGNAPQV